MGSIIDMQTEPREVKLPITKGAKNSQGDDNGKYHGHTLFKVKSCTIPLDDCAHGSRPRRKYSSMTSPITTY